VELLGIYIKRVLIMLIPFGILMLFWGEYNLFPIGDIWMANGNVLEGLASVWFIFAWGATFVLVVSVTQLISGKRGNKKASSGEILLSGAWISLNAGIFEELEFRWLRFSIAMIILPFANFILFGFISGQMGLLHWAYEYFLVPLADFVTFGALQDFLFHPASWVVGAAIISANGKFREAHEKNSWFNSVNAWFIGMVMFYLMFNYGLFTAIVAHVLYDMVLFVVAATVNSWGIPSRLAGKQKQPAFRV